MIRFSLDNGMRAVVDPSGRSDAAALYVWINVGSADEPPGMEGAAHFVEHMVFKGTRSYGVGEVAAAIEAMGGDLNAFTSFDETVFHATVPAAAAVPALGVLAEMLREARFDATELRRERGVILEEIRGTADDADSVLSEASWASAWPEHPYGRPVIGTTRAVRGMTRDALQAFYARHYQPSNACLAVAGPVDVDAVSAAARGLFAGGGAVVPRPPRRATPGHRRERALRRGFEACLVDIAWPGPGHGDPEVAPLDVLCMALGGGASSPLEARLRLREGLCLSAEASYEVERDGGMATVSLHAREGNTEGALAAAREEVARACAGGLGEAEIERAKAQILADRVFGRETVDGRAHTLAFHAERFGDPEAWRAYDAAVERVGVADVAAAAARWMTPERAVVTALLPDAERVPLRRGPGARVADPEVFVPGPLPAVQEARRAPRRRTATDRARFVLPNGARLILDPDEGEVAAVRIVGLGGSLGETTRSAGRTTAWARALLRGAGGRDAVGFAEAVESLAGSVGAAGGRSSQGIRAEFVADRLEEGLELVGDLLLRPSFAPAEIERVREEITEALAERKDHPEHILSERVWALAYRGHPYALSNIGTRAHAAALTARGLGALHRRWASAKNLVIALSGGFDAGAVRERLERILGALPAGEPLPLPALPTVPGELRRATVRSGREQAHISVAFPGVSVLDPQQPTVEVLAAVLGGQGGRLFVELREAHGLAYHVGAASQEGIHPGLFLCSVATDPERQSEASERLRESLARAAAGPITEEEVERARRYLLGALELDLQTASARANLAAYAELYGQDGLAYRADVRRRLEQVTVEGVRRCAARVLARPVVWGRVVPAGKE